MPFARFVRGSVLLVLALAPLGGCTGPDPAAVDQESATTESSADPEQIAPLLEGMGRHQFAVTTFDPMAQRFFDQGLALAYGFNHAEAERSFREAARRDPDCAMCWWGVALVNGPNINAVMEEDQVSVAWEALQKARELAPGVSEREQAYIEALSARYAEAPPEDRTVLDEGYADAMRSLVAADPDDVEARVLLAESLMDLHPWDYWADGSTPHPWTPEFLDLLEGVLDESPNHPGANHLYIHAVEASSSPERALPAADRLGGLVPGAGHLVHMPSHIYIRVGQYHDAVEANQRAVESDDDYVTQCHAQGIYPLAYMPHNHHFLWVSATLTGESELAIASALEIQRRIDPDMMREPGLGTLQHFWTSPLWAWVRFGRWDEILAMPEPDDDLVYPRGAWRFARGMALVSTADADGAEAELAALLEHAVDPAIESVTIWDINATADLLDIASEVLAGEIAAARGDLGLALAHLERAVELEDGLNYDEPPPWSNPTRQNLGAVLLAADRAADAEAVYRADLEVFRENGWSLFGLEASLRAQGKAEAADEVRTRFEAAWSRADVELASTRI